MPVITISVGVPIAYMECNPVSEKHCGSTHARLKELVGAEFCFKIDRRSHTPLYVQVKDKLAELIAQVKPAYAPFFTDEELSELFKVSRLTVREAVRELIRDGVLVRERGRGTFVRPSKLTSRLDRLESCFKVWTAQGKVVSAEPITFTEIACPDWVADLLAVTPGSRVTYINRLRRADGVPMAVDHRYLHPLVGALIEPSRLRTSTIFEILAERMPQDPPASVDFQVEAAAALKAEADYLDTPVGAPVLVRVHVLRSSSGRVLSVGRSIFRSDLTKWTISLPVKNEEPL